MEQETVANKQEIGQFQVPPSQHLRERFFTVSSSLMMVAGVSGVCVCGGGEKTTILPGVCVVGWC